jgi:oxygen-independent coproporphyrinogen III oxidase
MIAGYMKKLQEETDAWGLIAGEKYFVDSIYYGGGTPTAVDAEYYIEMNRRIKGAFPGGNSIEITLEANPGTLNAHQLDCIRRAGFNRASLGVQSLNDNLLLRMGRIHNSKEAEESYKSLESVVKNINVDLMFGLPGQTLDLWKDTLCRVLDWNPAHLSFYSLQLEEGTPFYKDYRSGGMDLPSWEENRRMYHFAVETIKAAGYCHYEISNAAKPGFECRHNLKYWTMKDYVGLGASAHSYIDGIRYANSSSLEEYQVGRPGENGKAASRSDQIGDYLFTELRLVQGFELADYRRRFGLEFFADYKNVAEALLDEGLLEKRGSYVRLTEKGMDTTNLVIGRLLNA